MQQTIFKRLYNEIVGRKHKLTHIDVEIHSHTQKTHTHTYIHRRMGIHVFFDKKYLERLEVSHAHTYTHTWKHISTRLNSHTYRQTHIH